MYSYPQITYNYSQLTQIRIGDDILLLVGSAVRPGEKIPAASPFEERITFCIQLSPCVLL